MMVDIMVVVALTLGCHPHVKIIISHPPVLVLLQWGYILHQHSAPLLLGVSWAHLPEPREPDFPHLV